MEYLNNEYLTPRLDVSPYFENDDHCEEWVEEFIDKMEKEPPKGINSEYIERAKRTFFYAKEILSKNLFPFKSEIDEKFISLGRIIQENEILWNDLGSLYDEVWMYLLRKKTIENKS